MVGGRGIRLSRVFKCGYRTRVEAQAINDAERDASAHLNKLLWFTTGFSLPVIGIFLSQRNQRSIPGARLLGKSPEYVAFYTNAYRIKMKKLRFNWSLLGCLGSTTVAGLTIFGEHDRNQNAKLW